MSNNIIKDRLSKADDKELQKCMDSPVYFYNKYVRKLGDKELTEEEYEEYIKPMKRERYTPLKYRGPHSWPLIPRECYEASSDSLKNKD